jgi:hypothetical protein
MGQMTNGDSHKDDFPVLGGQGKDVSRYSPNYIARVLIDELNDLPSAKSAEYFCHISTPKSDKPFSAFKFDTTFLFLRPIPIASCFAVASRDEPLRRIARPINTSHKTLSAAGCQSR